MVHQAPADRWLYIRAMSTYGTSARYIVFEGISGSGKTTQLKLLENYLVSHGQRCVVISEPTPLHAELRRHIARNRLTPTITALLYAVDRYAQVDPEVRRAFAGASIVLADRSYLSTLVYQGGRGLLSPQNLLRLHSTLVQPTDIVIIDAPAQLALARITKRSNESGVAIGEHESLAQLEQHRQRFLRLVKLFPHAHIAAADRYDAQSLHEHIKQLLGFS